METIAQLFADVGVPTAMLLALLWGGWKLMTRHLAPLVDRLVRSHVDMLETMRSKIDVDGKANNEILRALASQSDLLEQLVREVRLSNDTTSGNPGSAAQR